MYTVYKHITPNNKVYIGVTSQKPNLRWDNGNGYKNNIVFTKDIKKYGWDKIEHEILYETFNKDEAYKMERDLIEKLLNTTPSHCYNISLGTSLSEKTKMKLSEAFKGERHPMYGKKHTSLALDKIRTARKKQVFSEETRKKMSETKKGKCPSKKTLDKSIEVRKKKIRCIDTGVIYKSIVEAEKNTNISSSNICNVCKGKRKFAGGYKWEYVDEMELI